MQSADFDLNRASAELLLFCERLLALDRQPDQFGVLDCFARHGARRYHDEVRE